MISLRQRLHCLSLLGGGISVGLMLALLPRFGSGRWAEPVTVMLVVGLSFVLAALTGVAKTTTA